MAVRRRAVNKGKECANKKCSVEEDERSFRRNQIVCIVCENDESTEYDKKCSRCGETKTNTSFRKNRTYCLDCERADGRNYRRGEIGNAKAKEWHENNKERAHELSKNWYEENKTEIRAKERERAKNDDEFKVIKRYRVNLNGFIHGRAKVHKKIGASREIYMLWLNHCYRDDMKDDNYAKLWQIDHVISLNTRKDENAIEIGVHETLFRWYNTSPALKSENLEKNKYVHKEHILRHIKNLDSFYSKHSIEKTSEYFIYRKYVQKLLDEEYA